MQNKKEIIMNIMSELLETPEKAKELHLNYSGGKVEDVVEAINTLYSLVGGIETPTKKKEAFVNRILEQYKDIVKLVLELENLENLLDRYNDLPYTIVINGESPSKYDGEVIETIRIEHYNIDVYLNSNFEIIDEISISYDDGDLIGDFSLKSINVDNKDLMEMI